MSTVVYMIIFLAVLYGFQALEYWLTEESKSAQ